jgi:BirA family biotin operon repressor/biotin-[acetyl-CoA-carboxylase] ligase
VIGARELERALSGSIAPDGLGRPLVVLERCASTMDEARARLAQGAGPGLAVLALEQSAGRGRHGRTFVSPRGGLYLTAALRPPADPAVAWRLGFAAALAARDAVATAGGPDLGFDWPNDLVLGSRKVGGILAEYLGRGGPSGEPVVLVGIGLNLGPDPRDADPERAGPAGPIPFREPGRALPAVAAALLAALPRRARAVGDEAGWSGALESIRAASAASRGAPVRVQEPDGRVIEGVGEGIRDDGALLVRVTEGAGAGVVAVRFGERLWG